MYLKPEDYENVAKTIINIYIDYSIKEFPINEHKLCDTLGIKLLPYSEFPVDASLISDDAFYIPSIRGKSPIIIYNDSVKSDGRKRFSIFHEVKHFVFGDEEENPYCEKLANYFSKYIMCPIPLLIYRGVNDVATIMSDYKVSYEVAKNVLQHLNNRRRSYGNNIFDYEQELIDLIEGGD